MSAIPHGTITFLPEIGRQKRWIVDQLQRTIGEARDTKICSQIPR